MPNGPKMNDIQPSSSCACPYSYKFTGLWYQKFYAEGTRTEVKTTTRKSCHYFMFWKLRCTTTTTYIYTTVRWQRWKWSKQYGNPYLHVCQRNFGVWGGSTTRESDCIGYLNNYKLKP